VHGPEVVPPYPVAGGLESLAPGDYPEEQTQPRQGRDAQHRRE